jgi:hypothetical protein
MKRRVSPRAGVVLVPLLLEALVTSGCVERILVVRTEPSGADVYINGQRAGVTPLEHEFDFYLPMDIELRKFDDREGYRSVHLVKDPKIPWHQHFPLDFLIEFLVPWPIRDVHHVDVELEETRTFTREEWRDFEQELERKVEAARRTLGDG